MSAEVQGEIQHALSRADVSLHMSGELAYVRSLIDAEFDRLHRLLVPLFDADSEFDRLAGEVLDEAGQFKDHLRNLMDVVAIVGEAPAGRVSS